MYKCRVLAKTDESGPTDHQSTPDTDSSDQHTLDNMQTTRITTSAPPSSFENFVRSLRPPKLLLICGSSRVGSLNRMLLETALEMLRSEGAECEVVDLGALKLPLYDMDAEKAAFPPEAADLKAKMVACDGMIIVSPEYNGMPTPLLLNAITWATRGAGAQYAGFSGKCVSVMATSPGPMGGIRVVRTMQQMLQDMGAVVIPGHCTLGHAYKLFDTATGQLTDETARKKVEAACGNLLHFARFEANRDKDDCIVRLLKKQRLMGEYGEVS